MPVDFSEPLPVSSPKECTWYQTFDFPDGTLVRGRWDYRANVDDYLGRLNYDGQTVVEVGPASGYLTRAMEKRGADVTCFDTGPGKIWDIVPRLDRDTLAYNQQRVQTISMLWKGWWLTRNVFGGSAKISYSGATSIAELPEDQKFDIALVGSVLQHFENPFIVLSLLARRCQTIVVTEQYMKRLDLPGRNLMEFIPSEKNNDLGSWWLLGPGVVEQMMGILNFRKTTSYFSTFRRWDLKHKDIAQDTYRDAPFYTHVYEKHAIDAERFHNLSEV